MADPLFSEDPDFLFGVRGPIPSPTNPTLDTLFMNLSLNSYTQRLKAAKEAFLVSSYLGTGHPSFVLPGFAPWRTIRYMAHL